jgi:hypothetical protein
VVAVVEQVEEVIPLAEQMELQVVIVEELVVLVEMAVVET